MVCIHTIPGCVVGVSDFLMMSLAKLTVAVGKQVKDAVADTEVTNADTECLIFNYVHHLWCLVKSKNHLGEWPGVFITQQKASPPSHHNSVICICIKRQHHHLSCN